MSSATFETMLDDNLNQTESVTGLGIQLVRELERQSEEIVELDVAMGEVKSAIEKVRAGVWFSASFTDELLKAAANCYCDYDLALRRVEPTLSKASTLHDKAKDQLGEPLATRLGELWKRYKDLLRSIEDKWKQVEYYLSGYEKELLRLERNRFAEVAAQLYETRN